MPNSTPPTPAVANTQLIGLTKQAALALCQNAGVVARVAAEDGYQGAGTTDFNLDRVNLYISNGKVVSVRHG